MTTRITVTTGDGGLLERNAQQQAANRQGTLVKAQAEQAAATGAEQQRQRRIASGLDPATGRPLPSAGSTSSLSRIDQQPAAFRKGADNFLFWFPTAPTFDIQLLNGGGFPASLFMRLTETYPIYKSRRPLAGFNYSLIVQHPTHTSGVSYLPNAGPYGEPAMLIDSPQAVGFFASATRINFGSALIGARKSFTSFTVEFDYAANLDGLTFNTGTSVTDVSGEYTLNAQFSITCPPDPATAPHVLFLVVQVVEIATGQQTIYAITNFVPFTDTTFFIADINVWNRVAFTYTPTAAYIHYNGSLFRAVNYSAPININLDPKTLVSGAQFDHGNGSARVRQTKLCAFSVTPDLVYTSGYTPRSLVR